jgi:GDPmannose 4,6-dehydratase
MQTALITGITGQDGLHAAELLLERGYKVLGTTRDVKKAIKELPPHIRDCVELQQWDLIDDVKIRKIIDKAMPVEIYNYASITSGNNVFVAPAMISLINGLSVTKLLEAIRQINLKIKFAQASSSEMFGKNNVSPQSEETQFIPQTPYGIAKLYAHQMVNFYRERYGLFACSGILYNHESGLRQYHFVTRKITSTATKIKLGLEKELVLGNIDVKRDWIHAKDAVNAMRIMLQAKNPSDYIIASGNSRSVREFCCATFEYLELDYRKYVVSSSKFLRPAESLIREGNPKKIKSLGWLPSISFEELVRDMVDNDLRLNRQAN